MNCANHPDVAAAAYCQNCGKPLCTVCVRSVGGVVYCEQCLAARLSPGAANAPAAANYSSLHAHPLLAGLLGFIPGVGAMYNGQFVKALAHVLIFAVFVSLSDKSFFFGLLVTAWVFYQVFDAAQTAKARRDGLPLPNPFGLNDLGTRLGMAPGNPFGGFAAPPPPPPPPPPYAAGDPAAAPGFAAGPVPGSPATPDPAAAWSAVPPASGYTGAYGVPPVAQSPAQGPAVPLPPYAAADRHRHPIGAIVLIAIGVVLLLNTLGIFEEEWIGRTWPVILIGIGGWLLYRRTRDTNRDKSMRGGV